jgi:hypothetical protein
MGALARSASATLSLGRESTVKVSEPRRRSSDA